MKFERRWVIQRNRVALAIAAGTSILMLACGGASVDLPTQNPPPTSMPTPDSPEATPTPALISTPVTPAPPTADPTRSTAVPTPSVIPPTPIPTVTVAPPTEFILEILPESVARYKVKEQFARRDFPNDAIGETSDMSGMIVFDAAGRVQPERSAITVDLRTLRSDDSDRDDFLETDALESLKFPLAELIISGTPGLPWPLPANSVADFQLQGDMTLHGVTRPLTWEVIASFGEETVTGTATTNFDFDEFDMEKPSVFFLLSVEDNIRLELDFVATIEAAEAGEPAN